MKSWQLLIVTSAVAGFLYLAIYAHHHRHDGEQAPIHPNMAKPANLTRANSGLDHGYPPDDVAQLNLWMGWTAAHSIKQFHETARAYQLADLYFDDGLPVDQQIKVTEWARARKTMGK